MVSASRDSGLRYSQSTEDVRLGDRIEFRTLFLRRRCLGTVVCIPAMTGRERAELGKDPEDWLIKLDSGVFTGWLYSPEDLQPNSRLRLVSRAVSPTEEASNADLEEMEKEIEAKAGWLELAMPMIVVLFLLLLASGGLLWWHGVGT